MDALFSAIERVQEVVVTAADPVVATVAKPGKKPYSVLKIGGEKVVESGGIGGRDRCVEEAVERGFAVGAVADASVSGDLGIFSEIAWVSGAWRLVQSSASGKFVIVVREPTGNESDQ